MSLSSLVRFVLLCDKIDSMQKIFFSIVVAVLFYGCQDGDIITTTFDFEDTDLQFCGGPGGYLFYQINDANTESLSVRFGNTEQLFLETDTLDINLNGSSNFANFRIFNGEVDSDYFCNEVPPTTPSVNTEYIANSGILRLITTVTLDDNDGLNAEDELNLDSDGDGWLDYFDFDDDGDNVPTLLELDNEDLDGDGDPLTNPKDTDGDSIPDYLDDDDDGDGILTRYEDIDGDLNPTNNITNPEIGADYLNPEVTQSLIVDQYREHEYDFESDVRVILLNLVMQNGNETITKETINMGTYTNIVTGTVSGTPDF